MILPCKKHHWLPLAQDISNSFSPLNTEESPQNGSRVVVVVDLSRNQETVNTHTQLHNTAVKHTNPADQVREWEEKLEDTELSQKIRLLEQRLQTKPRKSRPETAPLRKQKVETANRPLSALGIRDARASSVNRSNKSSNRQSREVSQSESNISDRKRRHDALPVVRSLSKPRLSRSASLERKLDRNRRSLSARGKLQLF